MHLQAVIPGEDSLGGVEPRKPLLLYAREYNTFPGWLNPYVIG